MRRFWQKKGYSFLVMVLLFCGFLVSSILAVYGCSYSYYSQRDYSHIAIVTDNVFLHIFLFAILCALAWGIDWILCNKMSFVMQERVASSVLMLALIWILIVGYVYVRDNPYYPSGDQLNVTAAAYYNLQGDFRMLQQGGYIGLYEQQKGFMFLYEILFFIWGAFCYDKAELFHVLFAVLTLWMGVCFIKTYSRRTIYRIVYCFLIMTCSPLIIFLPYIYGDIPAVCFSMIMFWAISAYGKTMKRRYVVLAILAASLALLCRMNTWIVLIALGIGLIMLAIQKWNYKPLIVAACIILAVAGVEKTINVMYEYRSGYESGIGIPSILWVAMGLQETDGLPGIYNRYQQTVFEESGFNREIASQVGKEYILNRLNEFGEDVPMALDFFKRKIQSQWLEPLFESLYSTNSFKQEQLPVEWINELYYGDFHDVVWKISNYYQSVVFLAMLAFVVARFVLIKREENDSTQWIPLIAIVGGFLFSLIWESQCRYCFPYYVYMLLFVPEGILRVGDFVAFVVRNLSKNNDKQQTNYKQHLKKVS